MKKIKYVITGSLYRNNQFLEFEDVFFDKIFEGKTNQMAREKAINYYESILEVLLNSKGLFYVGDLHAQQHLKEFYDSEMFAIGLKAMKKARKNDMSKFISLGFFESEDFDSDDLNRFNAKEIRVFGKNVSCFKNEIAKNLAIEKCYFTTKKNTPSKTKILINKEK